ncbi:protein FAF, chloroplastic [Trifolium repens]|nr:protein FAF, chloroplastic [Trifolium repens]
MVMQNGNGSQNELSSYPMKNIDSSKELSHSKLTSELDIWSLILNQKNKDEASQLKTPYIHPLEKKSKNWLSEKSLEMCTESLGSETGSDWFSSSYTSSEDNNSLEVDEKLNVKVKTCDDENPKHNNYYSLSKKTKKPRCFPPPLPSLTSQSQHGQSQPLQMRSCRDNGRLFLFLQVVSIPSRNNFFATRQNGRLILTFANDVDDEDDEEIDDESEKHENGVEKTHMCSLELVANKEIELVNKNQKLVSLLNFSDHWSDKFTRGTNFENVQHDSLPRSFPLINGYEYYWRNKATGNLQLSGNMNINQGSNEASQDSQELFVLRGKNKDYLVHNLKFCKDSRTTRSFMFWDPCCIAT